MPYRFAQVFCKLKQHSYKLTTRSVDHIKRENDKYTNTFTFKIDITVVRMSIYRVCYAIEFPLVHVAFIFRPSDRIKLKLYLIRKSSDQPH